MPDRVPIDTVIISNLEKHKKYIYNPDNGVSSNILWIL